MTANEIRAMPIDFTRPEELMRELVAQVAELNENLRTSREELDSGRGVVILIPD